MIDDFLKYMPLVVNAAALIAVWVKTQNRIALLEMKYETMKTDGDNVKKELRDLQKDVQITLHQISNSLVEVVTTVKTIDRRMTVIEQLRERDGGRDR